MHDLNRLDLTRRCTTPELAYTNSSMNGTAPAFDTEPACRRHIYPLASVAAYSGIWNGLGVGVPELMYLRRLSRAVAQRFKIDGHMGEYELSRAPATNRREKHSPPRFTLYASWAT